MIDWNERYELGETPWDKGIGTPVLDEIARKHPDLLSGNVFVPGCGMGHDASWLAKRGCIVTGGDIAPLAVAEAQKRHAEPNLDFRLADVFDLPEDLRGKFDSVFEHTCLCALDPALRNQYAQGIKTSLKPNGHIVGVFFMEPEMDPDEEGPPFGISLEELTALWQNVGLTVQETWVPESGYPGRIGRERVMILG